MKQFRHYLLGCKFTLLTDHAPLQWLSAQKMEGLLARWALAIQEYDFHIVYHKGQQNNNSNALSRKAHRSLDVTAVSVANKMMPPSKRFARPFWNPLDVPKTGSGDGLRCDGIGNCGHSWSWLRTPCAANTHLAPQVDLLQCTIISPYLRSDILKRCHDAPGSGHLRYEKTLAKVRTVG